MKVITFLILFFTCLFSWAESSWAENNDEIGRSLANYEVCAQTSVVLDDPQMYFYYKKMFNDISLRVLALDNRRANQVYEIWRQSEQILGKLNSITMQQMCLSRFDDLSRKMINKIATKKASR